MRMIFAARAMHDMAGGVERMIVAIMNEMIARGHEVALFSWDRQEATSFYPLSPEIEWIRLDMGDPGRKAGLKSRIKRLPAVRKRIKAFQPDVIVCFQGGPFKALLLYTLGMNIPIVAAERTAPTLYEHASSARTREVEHFLFRFARKITVQFDRYRTYYPAALQKLIVETPNPVRPPQRLAEPSHAGAAGRFTLLSVGRLSYQKNYSTLLDAFDAVADDFPDWDLLIVGEGEDRGRLEARVSASSRLAGRVRLPGATKDVEAHYVSAQLFCLPSRWEGFPNALAEALAHGLPAVGFMDCAGVSDLIETGGNGILAPGNGDLGSLAAALKALMADGHLRGRMGRSAARSMEKYRPELCFDRWEAVLDQAVTR